MAMIKVDMMALSDEILKFGDQRRLARVKACRGRMRTGLRQALPERAHRMMEKERKHE